MAVEVITQKAMSEVARAATCCYICGAPLDPASGNGLVSRDHVIPSSLLGKPPELSADRWSVVLPVHAKCEDSHKESRDQFAKIISVMGSRGPFSWSPEELGTFRSRADVKLMDDGLYGPVPVIENVEDVLLAAWIWARGMHSALYREVLPGGVDHLTRCPAPAFRSDGAPMADQVREEREIKDFILNGLRAALRFGEVDRVRAWGGAIEYVCVWFNDPREPGESWSCLWALDVRGSQEWAMSVRGIDTPWYGLYELRSRPAAASVLSPEHIVKYNAWVPTC